jgi:hypothetical protein
MPLERSHAWRNPQKQAQCMKSLIPKNDSMQYSAGIGWFKKLLWALRLAIEIISTQVIGSMVNILLGRSLEGAVDVTASSALLFYVLRRRVRAVFRKPG